MLIPLSPTDAGKERRLQSSCSTLGRDSEAIAVKGKKTGNFAKSDWMDIEAALGFSNLIPVMQFDYDGKQIQYPYLGARGLL